MCFSIFRTLSVWFIKIWISFLTLAVCWVWDNCFKINKEVPVSKDEDKLLADKLRMDKIVFQITGCPEILKIIFQNSDAERLKKYRLVCKGWNGAICGSLSKSLWLVSVSSENFPTFRAEVESRDVSIPLPFEEVYLVAEIGISREDFLWLSSNFRVTRLSLTLFYPAHSEKILFIIQTCSPILTHLYTKCCNVWGESVPMDFPRLQVLHLHPSYGDNNDGGAPALSFFVRLISSAPQLIHLIIGGGLGARIVAVAKLQSLRELEILNDNDTFVWNALEEAEIQNLTHLSVYLSRADENEDVDRCEQALTRFSGSLKSLKVELGFAHPSRFPLCPYLTNLELVVYNPAALDLTGLPVLKNFTFWSVLVAPAGGSIMSGITSSSVRNIVFREEIIKSTREKVMSQEREATFLDLFRRFPNAVGWTLCYRNVVNFCRAASSTSFKVQSLTIALRARNDSDEEKSILLDKYVFSYVSRCQDLESLGLYNCTKKYWKGIRVKELDFEKLPNLRVLLTCSEPRSSFEEYLDVNKDLKVLVTGPRKFNGTERILSKRNVEFVPYPKSVGAWACYCDQWDPEGRRF